MESEAPIRVLFIDDEPGLLVAIRDYLSIVHSIEVDICDSASDALTREDLFSFDCLIIDYEMPDIDGLVLLGEIRSMNTDIPVIMFTGRGHEDVAIHAINAGADYYVKKGGNPEELFSELAHYIRKGVRRYRAEKELIEKERRYRAVVEDLTEFVCRMDPNGQIVFVNSAFLKSLQISSDLLGGVTFYSLYPDNQKEIEEAISYCDPDYNSVELELPFYAGHGRIIWHQWIIRILFNERFEIREIQAVGRDVSKQREQDRQGIILKELGLSLASSSTLESALGYSLSAAIDISKMETGLIYLSDKTDESYSLFLDQGQYKAALNRLVEEMLQENADFPVFSTNNTQYLSMTDMRQRDCRFTAVAFIPIQRYEEISGWFVLGSDSLVEVPYEIRRPLEGVVSQIGNVISRIEAEEALRDALIESEERYMQLSESSPDAITILTGTKVAYLNPAAVILFETTHPDDFIEKPLRDYFDQDLQEWFDRIIKTSARGQGPSTCEGFLKTRYNKSVYGEFITVPISHAGEDAILLLIRDKTNQRIQEQALVDSEKRFREMADFLPEPLFEADVNGHLTFFNQGVIALLNNSFPGKPSIRWASELVSEEDQSRLSTLLKKTATEKIPLSGDFTAAGNPENPRIIHLSLAPVIREGTCSGTRGVLIDITEIKRYQDRLQHMIEEKDVLFRELHHRVKNNMQIISSMLQLQEEYISDETVLSALHDCEQRIDSMALVHETLYRTESLADIPFDRYLDNLVTAVTEGFATVRDIRTVIDVGGIRLSLDTAVTIGLIVNELMVNSMKYAFTDRPSGIIRIKLSCSEENCILKYSDDGVGLPDGFDIEKIASLGMRLVRILAKQIRGIIQLESTPGTGMACIVTFPKQTG